MRPTTVLDWMDAGTQLFLGTVDGLTDSEFDAASGLPGWQRRHVIGHVARNAEALGRLLDWASTGIETRMYPSTAQRAEDIEASARQTPDVLRSDLRGTADAFAAKIDAHEAWDARVRTAQGRDIPAANVPWMRTCEVWLHVVDLEAGTTVEDFPDDVVDALLDETIAWFANHDCPPVLLAPTDRDRTWTVGADAEPTTGAAPELLAWLVGREDGTALRGPRPPLPPWR
jgi:maleylpyruvate isomerase